MVSVTGRNESLDKCFSLADLHHVGVVVADIEQAAADVERIYGMPVAVFGETRFTCRIRGIEQTVVQRIGLTAGPPHLELLREVRGSEIWTPVPGVHHLGFVVDDLASAAGELEQAGAPVWMAGVRRGICPVGATYHRDPLGQVFELLDRALADSMAERIGHSGLTG
ncbi:methylmalonyl-CoA/ethylmalonyl-CoA epimerase [Saccharopolyspora antimicrobica]|uniref:Methylmalonyl-CoA/ethylmalonyl-CoA epimerase n=1 Tax=Saccharopolyspora antimicrobica TaxID=455193 RepID=A0A1I4VXY5_9PSEU|nr:methylmalonyl-CoA/ethylmalonyl-CoA epimerase [Saccharopolyspora antimicrobica]SFN06010.1 methylmalonyl-CoA/ethylmalonyl-CoA epimerase [Saccharopolyspora antimicrobica]